jgi:mRNA interferase MazF
MSQPLRGEVWLTALDPTLGRKQAGTRPALIISDDLFNQSHAELVIAIPITARNKGIRSHVPVVPPEGGLSVPSYIKCEDIRSLSVHRLIQQLGRVTPQTLSQVERRLHILLGF